MHVERDCDMITTNITAVPVASSTRNERAHTNHAPIHLSPKNGPDKSDAPSNSSPVIECSPISSRKHVHFERTSIPNQLFKEFATSTHNSHDDAELKKDDKVQKINNATGSRETESEHATVREQQTAKSSPCNGNGNTELKENNEEIANGECCTITEGNTVHKQEAAKIEQERGARKQQNKPQGTVIGENERKILLGPHNNPTESWINDVIINAGQKLLKQRFPHNGGLRDTITLCNGSERLDSAHEQQPFAQIIFDETNEHWLLFTNHGCRVQCVRIYCSLLYKPSNGCLQTMLDFMNLQPDVKKVTIQVTLF